MSGYEVKSSTRMCPACQGLIPVDAVVCTRCGLNLKTGSRTREADRDPADGERKAKLLKQARSAGDVETLERLGARHKGGGAACAACGYDVTGLGGRPCPECGHERSIAADLHQRRQKQIEHYWRTTWLVGGVGLAAGAALTLGVGTGLLGWSMIKCIAHLAMCEGALFAGYFFVCLFIGYEEDVRGLAVRLMGVGSIWAGLWLATMLLPLPTIYSLVLIAFISCAALAASLNALTGRDWDDSFWIAAAAWVLKIIGWAALTMMVAL
ncbi:MAG: zinc ribbon domain-containing protein [Phycisphaerales bacterium]|nr:zinc ribbon domain-containing protein [Phycisphaerales bacterium]